MKEPWYLFFSEVFRGVFSLRLALRNSEKYKKIQYNKYAEINLGGWKKSGNFARFWALCVLVLMRKKVIKRVSTFGSRLTSIVSVALVLFLLGLVLMSGFAAGALTDRMRGSLRLVVKMEYDVSDAEVNALKQRFLADEAFAVVSYMSSDDIMEQESAFLADSLVGELDVNPYQAEFELQMVPDYANPDSIAAIASRYSDAAGVDEAVTDAALVAGVDRGLRRFGSVLLGVAAILLVISIALINNTVSLSVYSRRFAIHTMRLVGATDGFIRRPFVVAGAVNGLIAGGLASLLLLVVRAVCSAVDAALTLGLDWQHMALIFVALLLSGAALCSATAFVATSRYLATDYDDLFLS